MLLQPVTNNAIQGNINSILLAMSMAAIYLVLTKRSLQAGFWAAFAISIKLTPAILLIYFTGLKKYKTLAYSIAFSLVFLIGIPLLTMPMSDLMNLYQSWLVVLSDSKHFPLFKYTNQSPLAVFSHWFGNNTTSHIISQIPSLMAIGACTYFIFKKRTLSLLIGIFAVYLLTSPVVWLEYYLFLLFPFLFLNHLIISNETTKLSKILYWLRIVFTLLLVRAIVGKEAANLFAFWGQHLISLFLMLWIFYLEKESFTKRDFIILKE